MRLKDVCEHISYLKRQRVLWKISILSVVFAALLLVLDLLNVPSELLMHWNYIYAVIIVGSGVISAIVLHEMHIVHLLRVRSLNKLDYASFVAALSVFFYVIGISAFNLWSTYKAILIGFITFLIFVFILLRNIRCILARISFNQKSKTARELVEFYNKVPIVTDETKPILIAEREVEYDLLGRERVVNHLCDSIAAASCDSAFVIGLQGPWGSGKSTVINLAKKQIAKQIDANYVLVENFDPWIYETPQAVLSAMFDAILLASGIKYSEVQTHRMARKIYEVLTGNDKIKNWGELFSLVKESGEEKVKRIKEEIESYLLLNNKRLVVFIDNLDRATADNVIFLLKIIATIFNFKNTVYVLCYDAERMSEIMRDTLKIDPHYLEKIVQQEIVLPQISEETRCDVFLSCFDNILKCYGVELKEEREYKMALEYIVHLIPDMRAYKRFINSVLPIAFLQNHSLCILDLLVLESLRFLRPRLYDEIYTNKVYFVSHDQIVDADCYIAHSKKDFEKNKEDYSKKLASQYDAITMRLLGLAFPHIYSDPYYEGVKRSNDEIAQLKCIRSAKYFDLFFVLKSNAYLEINDDVKMFVRCINENEREAEKHLVEILGVLDAQTQKEWFEVLQLHLNLVEKGALVSLAKVIADSIKLANDQMFFAQSNAQTRAIFILSIICEKCSEKELGEIMIYLRDDYKQLRVLGRMMHIMKQESEQKDSLKERYELIKLTLFHACKNVIEQKINIYQNECYFPGGIWSLKWYLEEIKGEYTVIDYVEEVMNGDNIYRILGDLVRQSIGKRHGYSIPEETFCGFISQPDRVDKLLYENPPKTESEMLIKEVYDVYRTGEPDVFGDKGVSRDTPIMLDL